MRISEKKKEERELLLKVAARAHHLTRAPAATNMTVHELAENIIRALRPVVENPSSVIPQDMALHVIDLARQIQNEL